MDLQNIIIRIEDDKFPQTAYKGTCEEIIQCFFDRQRY